MSLSRYGDSYQLWDGDEYLKILALPHHLTDRFNSNTGPLLGVDLCIRVNSVAEYDYYSYMRAPMEYYYYEPKPSKCTCGAAHTFMPSHHSDWCDSHTLE